MRIISPACLQRERLCRKIKNISVNAWMENESYQIYQFDSELKKQFMEGFEYFYIYDLEELPQDWLEHHPTMIQEGTYYRKYRLEDIDGTTNIIYEDLSEQQWKDSLNIF